MKIIAKITHAAFAVMFMFGGAAVIHTYAPSAYAQAGEAKQVVDRAKADGLIGEQIDGYLGLVRGGVPGDVQAAMNEINILRKSAYTKLARAQGVSVDVVAALSGEKLVAKAAPGEMVKLNDGQWRSN